MLYKQEEQTSQILFFSHVFTNKFIRKIGHITIPTKLFVHTTPPLKADMFFVVLGANILYYDLLVYC